MLGLGCVRLLWRLTHPALAYPASMAAWQKKVASGSHGMLYFLILAVPISGYFYSLAAGVPVVYLGVLPLPVLIAPDPELKSLLKEVHYWLDMILLGAFIPHVLAALKHHFIDQDGVFERILP